LGASLLIVDDEEHMIELLSMILENDFEVTTAMSGEGALRCFRQRPIDLCLLDIMMPGMDGLELLRRIREEDASIPVLFITARAQLEERVEGLESGADDYITKPFEPAEVLARVKSVLRRAGKMGNSDVLVLQGLRVDHKERRAWVDGNPLKLTPIEFDLLLTFVRHPRQAFAREQLLDRVWGHPFEGDVRTVDTHIKNLREKLERAGLKGQGIQTVWGYGYRWGAS
jgi:DNA-binding response OmpR family regulator